MKSMWIAATAIGILVARLMLSSPADAQEPPEITYQWPQDGQVLEQRPTFLRMCFAEPVDVRDLHLGGKFDFGVTAPEKFGLGLRIVFQPDGQGVAVYPGLLPSGISEQGEWNFEWLVRDADTEEEEEGALAFAVADGGDEILEDPPETCPGGGGSPVASPGSGESPGASPDESATPTQEPDENGTIVEDDDDGPNKLQLALLTVGIAGAAGVVGLLGYALRNRVGFWLHRPPERKGDGDEGHH